MTSKSNSAPGSTPSRSLRRPGDSWLAVALLAPSIVILGVFVLWPALESVHLSLLDFDPFMTHSNFVGFENYKLLSTSPDYWESLGVTFIFLFMTAIPNVIIALLLALALDREPFLRGIFRSVFLMPVAVSSAMAAMLWIFIYNPSSGFLNYGIEYLFAALGKGGTHGPNWLGDPDVALASVAVTTIWKEVGFNIIFFLAGLASIPSELKAAAKIDGAGSFATFWHVTLPLLAPTVLFVSVVSILNSFQSFGQIHILTAGGPANATNTLVYNLYRDAFENFQTGSASAQAVILFLLMLIATVVQFRISKGKGSIAE